MASGEWLERLQKYYAGAFDTSLALRTYATEQANDTDDAVNQFRANHPPVALVPEKPSIRSRKVVTAGNRNLPNHTGLHVAF